MIRRIFGAASAVVVLALLTACGSDSASTGGRTVEVSITNAGCDPSELALTPGSTNFHVKNNGAQSITEFEVLDSGGTIVGEKENLTPGLDGRFTVDLKVGQYTLACPGGTEHPTGKLVVSDSGHSDSGQAADDSGGCVPTASAGTATGHVAAALSDFKIDLAQSSATSGAVAVDGTNNGTHPHEIVVVKGVLPADLPTKADGSVDEDKIPTDAVVGELESFSPGRSCSATFTLTSGSYTLFCNVVGDEGSHFQKGMVNTLTVS